MRSRDQAHPADYVRVRLAVTLERNGRTAARIVALSDARPEEPLGHRHPLADWAATRAEDLVEDALASTDRRLAAAVVAAEAAADA